MLGSSVPVGTRGYYKEPPRRIEGGASGWALTTLGKVPVRARVLSEDVVGRVEILGAEHLVDETRDERGRCDAYAWQRVLWREGRGRSPPVLPLDPPMRGSRL